MSRKPQSDDKWMERLTRYGDAREQVLQAEMYADYKTALETAIKRYDDFIKKLMDVESGKYKPPDYYVKAGEEAIARWKKGFITEQLRRGQVVEGIARELTNAGQNLGLRMEAAMADIYTFNHNLTLKRLDDIAGVKLKLAGYNPAQARVLYQATQTPLTKLALQRYANDADIETRLRREFLNSISTGESNRALKQRVFDVITGETMDDYIKRAPDPLIKACKSVVSYEMRCAARIVQTERTRIQNQASYDAEERAASLGVRIENEWSCQMIPAVNGRSGSRDTDRDVNGKRSPQGVAFVLKDGDKLMYPGDPRGRACNVINCHCTLIPHVILPGEKGGRE